MMLTKRLTTSGLLEATIEAPFSDARMWPTWLRRTYLIGWPVFMPLRVLYGVLVMLAMAVTAVACCCILNIIELWAGKKTETL